MFDKPPSFDLHTIVAAIGGAMSFMVRSRDLTTWQRCAYGGSGAIGAYYSAIWISSYWELGSGSTAAIGFMLGNIIVHIFDKLVEKWSQGNLYDSLIDFILRRANSNKPPPPGAGP